MASKEIFFDVVQYHLKKGQEFFLPSIVVGYVMEASFWTGKDFFLFWPVFGKVKITRFFVKALCARSAPRPAKGRPWRALRWDNKY